MGAETPHQTTGGHADTSGHIAEYVNGWQPNFDATDTAVDTIRDAVAAAEPRHRSEARNALRWGCEYLDWRTANNHTHDDLFDHATIDKFLTDRYGLAPKGTSDAIRSHLRRLAPGAGFGHTTRKAATNPNTPTSQQERDAARAVASDVATAIAAYVPQRLEPARWDAVAHTVRHAVTAASPNDPKRAEDLIRHGAYLAGWVHHNRMLPMRADTVFAAATIESFLDVIADAWPESSVRTIAANLHHLRAALHLTLDVERRHFTADPPKQPYTRTEIDGLYRLARSIPTGTRRRYVTCGLDLVLGCGVTGADAGRITPDQIINADDHVTLRYQPGHDAGDTRFDELGVRPRERHVRVLERHAERLITARDAAIDAGETYLLGGTAARHKRLTNVLKPHAATYAMRFDTFRGRLTWAYEVGKIVCEHVGGVDGLVQLVRRDTILALLEDSEP